MNKQKDKNKLCNIDLYCESPRVKILINRTL